MQTTIRFHMNHDEANLAHNTDEQVRSRESHIRADPKCGHVIENWCLNYSSAEEAVADILAEDLDAYNKKQKRKSRCMTMEQYLQSVKDDRRGKGHKVKCKKADGTTGYRREKREQKRLLYETIVSCGNTSFEYDKFGKIRYDSKRKHIRPQEVPYEVNYAVARRYYETFEKRNPNFRLVSCAWHNDEGFYNKYGVWEYGIAHAQLCFVPIGTGYKQGMSRQVSIGHALANMGYADTYEEHVDDNGEAQSVWVCAYTLWERDEAAYLEQLLQEEYSKYCKKHRLYAKRHGRLEIIHPVKGRKAESLAPREYSENQRIKEENAEATAELSEKCDEISTLVRIIDKVNNNPFSKNKGRHYLTDDGINCLNQLYGDISELKSDCIAGKGYLMKAKKEYEAAEKLRQDEEQLIKEQGEASVAQEVAAHKKALEEELEKYKIDWVGKNKKHIKLMRDCIEFLSGKGYNEAISEFKKITVDKRAKAAAQSIDTEKSEEDFTINHER